MDGQDGQVVDLEDEAAIVPALLQDRRWAAYAICDLEPPHRAHSRYIGHVRGERADAVVLVYAPPSFTSMVPCGSEEGVRHIFAAALDLPASLTFLLRRSDLAALETRYRVEQLEKMLRLAVDAEGWRSAGAVDADVRRLGDTDLPELEALYAIWPDSVFGHTMFVEGVYYGAYRDGALIAAAGTHAVSARHGIAVIGGVFTHPEHRGAGLGKATTGAVTRTLIEGGVLDVVLNVRADNQAAISAYERLGFVLHEPFWEGRATLR
jgi:RimJ/RimL family protein N-acetyltransferase